MIVESRFCINKAVATMTAMSRIRPLEISGSASLSMLIPGVGPRPPVSADIQANGH